jgi:hypothetical protein
MPRSWTWLFWDLGKGRRIIVAPCGMQCYAKEKDDDGADDEDAGGPADAFPAGVGGSHDASVTAGGSYDTAAHELTTLWMTTSEEYPPDAVFAAVANQRRASYQMPTWMRVWRLPAGTSRPVGTSAAVAHHHHCCALLVVDIFQQLSLNPCKKTA